MPLWYEKLLKIFIFSFLVIQASIDYNVESPTDDNRRKELIDVLNPSFISEIEETISTESAHNVSEVNQPTSEVQNEPVRIESAIISPTDNQNEVDITFTTSNTTNETAQFDTENVLKKGNVAAIVRLFSQDKDR